MDISNINHVGMVVRDLAETTRRYEAMGFQLTPYSPHSGAWKPGELVQPLGSGNRCVMFKNTYLEILANEDSLRPAERIVNFLKHHQGAHIVCFDCPDCDVVERRLRANEVATSGVIPLQREIDTPDGVRTAKFVRVQFSPKDSPEGYIQATTHLTPEYIYQPRYIGHANGGTQLSEAVMVTADLAGFVRRYQTYIGATPSHEGGAVHFRLSLGTTLTLADLRDAAAMLPGTLLPPIPGIAAVAFRTPRLAETRQRLISNGFTVIGLGDRFMVPAEEASGVAVLFGE